MKEKLKKIKFSTTQMIVFGFLAGILIGTALLMLPIATKPGETTTLIDALFTATTSICVTGLVTVNTLSHWTTFGHIVILILIQFGGLGVVTFTTTILLMMRKRITLRERLLIQEAYNLDTLRGLVRLTIKIIKGTLIVEGIGAVLYSIAFVPRFGFFSGIGRAIFNSVSAFCNAGMDLLGENSLAEYVASPLVNFTTMGLIILGGIGFPVWWDVITKIKKSVKDKLNFKTFARSLRLHTKIAIGTTILLIAFGTIIFFIMEYNNPGTIGNLNLGQKIMASMFQSVTTRTAGFLTVPQENLTSDSAFISIILMFIGGSPSGTAGGVKTVTIAMLFLAAYSIIRGKQDVELHRRRIEDFYIKKALAVILVSSTVLFISTVLLSVVEGGSFLDVLFETTSALATVGLTRGLTPSMSGLGKFIIIVTMYLGRIGPMSMALAFNIKAVKGNGKHLPGENISVG
jgi:trk system potassium uptake protein